MKKLNFKKVTLTLMMAFALCCSLVISNPAIVNAAPISSGASTWAISRPSTYKTVTTTKGGSFSYAINNYVYTNYIYKCSADKFFISITADNEQEITVYAYDEDGTLMHVKNMLFAKGQTNGYSFNAYGTCYLKIVTEDGYASGSGKVFAY